MTKTNHKKYKQNNKQNENVIFWKIYIFFSLACDRACQREKMEGVLTTDPCETVSLVSPSP
jgi:hypothetical protein